MNEKEKEKKRKKVISDYKISPLNGITHVEQTDLEFLPYHLMDI